MTTARAEPAATPSASLYTASLEQAHRDYTERFGLPTRLRPAGVELRLGGRVGAVAMRTDLAREATRVLWTSSPLSRVLSYGGAPGLRVVVVEDDTAAELPHGVVRLRRPSLPLPPTRLADGPVRWVAHPTEDTRRLLPLSRLLLAVITTHHAINW
ncbi:MAG: hypothetical protein HOY78_22940 [Saccharothrix sp.]|nr:hypothetical protein [Saccharothrix sp.]